MKGLLFVIIILLFSTSLKGQEDYTVMFSPLLYNQIQTEGLREIHVLNNGENTTVDISGVLTFGQKSLNAKFSMTTTLASGVNTITLPYLQQWIYSHHALKELIINYNSFPAGDFQLCLTIKSRVANKETGFRTFKECHYGVNDPLFLIQLIEPADESYLNTFWPNFIWVANHTAGFELQYNAKVVEMKGKQSAHVAINRNSAMYSLTNEFNSSFVYPNFAKPLENDKKYAWQVYAYYKKIYLGKSEVWTFQFKPEELNEKPIVSIPYLDVKNEKGRGVFDIYGLLKLKYVLNSSLEDTLNIQIYSSKDKKIAEKKVSILKGDNFIDWDFYNSNPLRHDKFYKATLKTTSEEEYNIHFKYFNPDFLDNNVQKNSH